MILNLNLYSVGGHHGYKAPRESRLASGHPYALLWIDGLFASQLETRNGGRSSAINESKSLVIRLIPTVSHAGRREQNRVSGVHSGVTRQEVSVRKA